MRFLLMIALLLPVGMMAGCHNSSKVADSAEYKQVTFSIDGMT